MVKNSNHSSIFHKYNMEQTLVVLPYSQSGSQGNELDLCIRLWEKYCTFPYKFIVIGTFEQNLPELYPDVEFIYKPKLPKRLYQYNQHLDVMDCFDKIGNRFGSESTGFIWIADDNYAIKPFTLEDIKTIHYLKPDFEGQETLPPSFWKRDLWKTKQLLVANSLPSVNYTTHFPAWLEFAKLCEIADRFDMRNESYVMENIYFNYFQHDEPVQVDSIRLGIWKTSDINRIDEAISEPFIKFICNSVDGWNKGLEYKLKSLI